MTEDFDVKLVDSTVRYTPGPEYKQNSWLGDYETAYREFLADPDAFWERVAKDLDWIRPWDTVKEWNYPYAKWFVNAKLNITANCLDRQVKNHRRNKVALIWRGEEGERIYTYQKLLSEVMRFANGLKKIGVKKGDRVCIYMPMVPEQVIAMLACARIGAIHSVVFAGFGVTALNMRIREAEAKVVISADISIRRGKAIPLITTVQESILNAPSVEHLILYRRRKEPPVEIRPDFEIDFYGLMEGVPATCEPEVMDAEDPLFMLYTSGSTGSPKGIVHTCAGYLVGIYYTTKYVFDLKESDIYWCTADPGWITGHSYIVYGPLAVGATVFITEMTPDYPDPGIWWKLVEEQKINVLYTAPTAIRMFMKMGEEWPNKYDLSSLRVIGSVGEPLNPEAFVWYHHAIGGDRCPIVDTWWQTETGMQMVTTMVGEPMRPGFAGKAVPGVIADVVDRNGNSVPPGTGGFLAIRAPWPAMFRTVYKNDERYRQYWYTIKDCYAAGDLAVKGKDNYIMVLGRADDIIIVAGHNIGTAEVESALVSHHAVAEAAVIGKPDPVKGNSIKAFVILRVGNKPGDKLLQELMYHVRMTIGPIAVPHEIEFVEKLPKTRSGKIMRRVLKAKEMGIDPGDISTLEE